MKGCRNFVGNGTKTVGHDNENDNVNDFSNADTAVKEEVDEYEKGDVTYITSPLKEETTHRCSLKMKIKRKVKTEHESFHEIIDSSIQAPKKSRNKRKTFSSSTTKTHEQANECESGKNYRNEAEMKEIISKNVQKSDHPSEDLQEKIIYDDSNTPADVDTADACVETSLGHFTEPEGSGPCEPGTSVVLEGVVWNETPSGVLVVNVSWRGRTYVGTLLDASKQDWRTPRLMNDAAGIDLDYKGKSSRNRKKNCLMKSSSNKKTKKVGVNEDNSVFQYVVESECTKVTCDEKDCFKQFKSFEGLAYHKASAHGNNSALNETNASSELTQNPLNLKVDIDKGVDEKTLSPYHAFKIQSDAGSVYNSEPDANMKSVKEECTVDDCNSVFKSDTLTNNIVADDVSSEEKLCKLESITNGGENLERSSNCSNESTESTERSNYKNTSPQPTVCSPLQSSPKTCTFNSKRTNVNEVGGNKKTKFSKIQNGYEISSSSSESTSVEIARLQTLTEDIPISFASEIDSIVGPDDVNIRRRPQRFDPSLGTDTMDMSDSRSQNFPSQFYLNENYYYHRPPSWATSNSFPNMASPVCDPLHLNAMNDYLNRCILNRNPSSKNS